MLSGHTSPVVFAGSNSVFPFDKLRVNSLFLPYGNDGKLTLTVAIDYRTGTTSSQYPSGSLMK